MRAAHAYLEGTFESPGATAEAYGCKRQLVNYYVLKMANAGVTRSTSASSEVRELEFDGIEEQSRPSARLSVRDLMSALVSIQGCAGSKGSKEARVA